MLYRLQNKIPFIITVLGLLYIVSPVLYYLYYYSQAQTSYAVSQPAIEYSESVRLDELAPEGEAGAVESLEDLEGPALFDVRRVLSYAGDVYMVQFIVIMVVTPIVGLGLVLKRKWGLVLFFVYGIALIIQNIVNWALEPKWFSPFAVLGVCLITAVLLLFIRLELRAPFYRPEWRIRGKRFKIVHQISWRGAKESAATKSETVDISPAGCFIKSETPPEHGDQVVVNLAGTEFAGEVTWLSPGTRRYAKGFGVKFLTYSRDQEAVLHKLLGKA